MIEEIQVYKNEYEIEIQKLKLKISQLEDEKNYYEGKMIILSEECEYLKQLIADQRINNKEH